MNTTDYMNKSSQLTVFLPTPVLSVSGHGSELHSLSAVIFTVLAVICRSNRKITGAPQKNIIFSISSSNINVNLKKDRAAFKKHRLLRSIYSLYILLFNSFTNAGHVLLFPVCGPDSRTVCRCNRRSFSPHSSYPGPGFCSSGIPKPAFRPHP